jgi:transposase-like protein
MPKKKRQTFSPEFKREAVRLLNRGDKEIAQQARELGVRVPFWSDLTFYVRGIFCKL